MTISKASRSEVMPGRAVAEEVPAALRALWIRFTAARDTTVTARFDDE